MEKKATAKKTASVIGHMARVVGKFLAPHLSKGLGSNRPPTMADWRNDPKPLPPALPFTPSATVNPERQAGRHHIPSNLRKPYRILCLDGGGVRGMLTVCVLQRIVKKHPTFFDNVDAIVGTSAGGILSLLLSAGYTPDQCEKIFDFSMPHIFSHNPWRVINPFRAKYSDKSKEELLRYFLGERKMVDLERTCTVIAFRLDGHKSKTHSFFHKEGWRPAIFSNMHKGDSNITPDADLFAWEAAMSTSAAPTFFPVHRGYTDGGIVANNPSIVAISKAIAHLPNLSTRNIVLLSLGAGTYPRHTNIFSSSTREGEVVIGKHGDKQIIKADWGIKQWIPFLLDLLLDGDSITSEMVMQYLLGAHGLYHRLDPQLPRQIALDDVTAMPALVDFAATVDMDETMRFIEMNFMDDYSSREEDGGNSLDTSSQYNEAWAKNIPPNGSR